MEKRNESTGSWSRRRRHDTNPEITWMDAHGVDLFPRGSDVETGDFLHLQYPSDSIDLCISQCAFFVSRDQKMHYLNVGVF